MSASDIKDQLVLKGVVSYALDRDDSGNPILDARWVSTRIAGGGQTGIGRAVRNTHGDGIDAATLGFEGDWTIKYFGPDGNIAVTPFLLNLSKNDQLYHGRWLLPNGDLVLNGFGFEDGGKLIMQYGSP